ncbi:MAG: phytanoyl-CoA dioxygenase family protein [Verrucomicrobiota bacterium]|jgi:Phytanoyl-CoA dioxygenase (PhyH)
MLSQIEKDHFKRNGWVGPFPLLTHGEVSKLHEIYESSIHRFTSPSEAANLQKSQPFPKPWYKSLHAHLPDFKKLVNHPSLVERVSDLLGPDIIAWGVSVTVRQPGQIHRWHVDVEHKQWRGVSAFIGLTGTSSLSSLKVISGSHNITDMPQTLKVSNDIEALKEAKKRISSCEIQTISMSEGEFFIFDGLLWHGSINTSNLTRLAAIAQFSSTSERVGLPLSFDEPVRWHDSQPACILVKGRDEYGRNVIIT